MKKNRKGFTLIELLVVIAIIGLLSTLAIVSLNTARQKSRDTKRMADIRTLQSAIELCINEAGSPPAVPAAPTWAGILGYSCGTSTIQTFLSSSTMPVPPQSTCVNPAAAIATGDCYMYCKDSTAGSNKYLLAANDIEAQSTISGDIDSNFTYSAANCVNSAGAVTAALLGAYCADGSPSVFCLGQ